MTKRVAVGTRRGLAWGLAGWLLACAAWGQSAADDGARQAEAALRQAQNLVFAGKRDEAVQALVQGHEGIRKIRQANASDSRLAGLEGRLQRLKGDLEKRMGKTIDLASGESVESGASGSSGGRPLPDKPVPPPMAPPAAAPAVASTAAPAKLPYHAAQKMAEVDKRFGTIRGPYSRFDYYREQGDYGAISKSLDGIEQSLADLPALIEEARRLAAEKGVERHPDFDAAYERIEQEKTRAAETRRQTSGQASTAAAAEASVAADVDTVATAYDRLRAAVFEKAFGGVIHYADLEPVRELLAVVDGFERNEQAQARAMLADFAARYGASRDAIDGKVRALGYSGTRIPGTVYEEFSKGIDQVAKTRLAMGADLLRRAREDLDQLPKAHDFFRADRRDQIRAFAEVAARFDPASEPIREFRAGLEARLAEDVQAGRERIDARKWPGSVAGKKAEEEAGLAFFRQDADWGARPKDKDPRIPVAVAITGDWTVQKRDLLGRPVMHGVPALVAVEVPAEKARDQVLRVYSVTLRTAEGADAKPMAPFREITVGDSYYIRPSAVK